MRFNEFAAALVLFMAVYCMHLTNATFGNEYVHIKVHVPKEQAPTIIETEPAIPPAQPHKVIHHYHHSARSRSRGAAKKTHTHGLHAHTPPLLESVILSELDKPLHMNEHTDYLQHAKEIAEQLSKPVETYIVKKAPPKVPKKKVNTYTIIEEKHRPQTESTHDYNEFEGHEHGHGHYKQPHVETFKVIDTKPNPQQQQQQPQHEYDFHEEQHQHQLDNSNVDNGFGYDYHQHGKEQYQTIKLIESSQADNYNAYKTAAHRPHSSGGAYYHKKHRKPHGYSKPAPVEELISEPEGDGYGYHYGSGGVQHQKEQQHYFHQKKYAKQRPHAPTPTQAAPLEAPDVDSYYGAHYQNQQQHHSNSFKPSPQIFDAQPAYEEDSYLPEAAAAPAPHRQMHAAATGYIYNHPAAASSSANVDWPEPSGYNNGASETYSGIDSYSVGHVQGVDSSGYQYAAPPYL